MALTVLEWLLLGLTVTLFVSNGFQVYVWWRGTPSRTWTQQVLKFHRQASLWVEPYPRGPTCTPDLRVILGDVRLGVSRACQQIREHQDGRVQLGAMTTYYQRCRQTEKDVLLVLEEFDEVLQVIQDAKTPAELAHEVSDLIYVLLGLSLSHGLDLDVYMEATCQANLRKVAGIVHKRTDGKILKPPGWTPPNYEKLVSTQTPLPAKKT